MLYNPRTHVLLYNKKLAVASDTLADTAHGLGEMTHKTT